jgi:hypothetical protein
MIDGLWLGVSNITDQGSKEILDRVESALRIIETYDAQRYRRLQRDLQRIWVRLQTRGNTGLYNFDLGACELDPRYVLRADVQPSDIASVVVHEATHARLNRFGFTEDMRSRIEAACRKQERIFSEHLPPAEGDKIREKLGRMDQVSEDFWSDASVWQRREAGISEALQYIGAPRWTLPLIKFLRRGLWLIRRFLRAVGRLASGLTSA